MKKLYSAVIILLAALGAQGQLPEHQWTKTYSGVLGLYNIQAQAVNSKGEHIAVGMCNEDFYHDLENEGINEYLSGPGRSFNGFVAKTNVDGSHAWTDIYGDEGFNDAEVSEMSALALDMNDNIYVGGNFNDSLVSINNPGWGLKESGSYTNFLAKLDDNGNIQWLHSFGQSKRGGFYQLQYHKQAIYALIAGDRRTDFDPGAGEAKAKGNVFLLKLSLQGELKWVKGFYLSSRAPKLRIHSNGDLYIAGDYTGTATFNPEQDEDKISNPNFNFYNGFFCIMDSTGSLLSLKQFGGPGNELVSGFDIDEKGDLYFTGPFSHLPIWLNPDTLVNKQIIEPKNGLSTYKNGYISKISSQGKFRWSVHLTANGDIEPSNIMVDDSAYVYCTANTLRTANINRYDSSGTSMWSTSFYGFSDGNVNIAKLQREANGDLFAIGSYKGLAQFDPAREKPPYRLGGMHVTKLGKASFVGQPTTPAAGSLAVYPNPSRHTVHLAIPKPKAGLLAIIYDASGRQVFSQPVSGSLTTLQHRLQPGSYLLRLQDAQGQSLGQQKLLVR